MKNLFLAFSALAITLVFSGCSKNNSGPSNIASVMFVNACDGTTNIDTKINNTKLATASNLAYFNNSGYQNITAGTSVSINFFLTNLGTPLCNGTPGLTASDHYSIFAGGIITAPSFLVATDDLTLPATGNTKVRFINLSNDTLYESFSIGSQTLDSNITSSQYTSFYEIAAATAVEVTAVYPGHTSGPYLAILTNQTFVAGKIYTIMLTGTHLGSGSAALTLTVINNN